MVKYVVIVTCLLVTSLAAAASADPLLNPAHGTCLAGPATAPAAGDVFMPPARPLCGMVCDDGGSTPTQSTLGGAGDCASMSSSLTSSVTAAATAACQQLTGREPCSVVVHLTGCLLDGDPDYLIEYGYATYTCRDTNC
jgi:uncharacterized protein with beta-barrel porin domain